MTYSLRGLLNSSANSQAAPRAWNRIKAADENDGFKVLTYNKYMINDIMLWFVVGDRINQEKVGCPGRGSINLKTRPRHTGTDR